MRYYDFEYSRLVKEVLRDGVKRKTRNANTVAKFATTLVIDALKYDSFPLLTSRKMFIKGIAGEMAAFLVGPKKLSDFTDKGCNYWKEWADDDGSIRVDYGNKWLDFNGVNQLRDLVNKIKNDPTDRRLLVSGWDPSSLPSLSLPCCHLLYQFYVTDDGYVDMIWYQRSADVMIGVPSDAVLAAIFLILVANSTGLKPGVITMHFGDTHIYEDHIKQANDFLTLDHATLSPDYVLESGLFDFEPQDLVISNYNPGTKINFKLHR